MATGAGMSGVIGRIKSAAPLSCTSGFETLSAANNGGFGLDWITDELMTVKRARRLYISLIISVWRRSRRGSHRQGAHPHAECLEKGIDVHTRAGLRGPGLSHPLGAFNKSIQATGGPHTCGHNRRRMVEGGSVRGMTHGGYHCSIPRPSHQDWQSSRERKNEGRIYRERARCWQNRAVGQANQRQIPSIIYLFNRD